jgi:hypothetical protein
MIRHHRACGCPECAPLIPDPVTGPHRAPTDARLCIYPHPACRCPECRQVTDYDDRSNATDDEFARAVRPFYDDTEPAIESANWDRED